MKKTKKNYVAVVLIVLLLALAVGYAAFNQALPISGTANANANWDVKFAAGTATITNSIVDGTTENTVKIAPDGKSMDVTVNLATPGDGANISVDITNAGSLPAEIEIFTVSGDGFSGAGNTYTKSPIQVKVPTVTTGDELDVGATKTFEFSVEWDPSATSNTNVNETATFTITFNYKQSGVNGTFNGTQNFTNSI